jgi:hypothetical protein
MLTLEQEATMDFELAIGVVTCVLTIILTVAAWRKGWGPRALLPFGITVVIGVAIGVVLGESSQVGFILGVLSDLVAMAILALMIRQAPQRATRQFAQ